MTHLHQSCFRSGSSRLTTDDSRLSGHDQLYSPVVLVNSSGSIEDRYEYDAYGSCAVLSKPCESKGRILNADYSGQTGSDPFSWPEGPGSDPLCPHCGNPYLFTGREVDYLDSGSLALQYNRHRYYSQPLGRWTSEDPLGTDPAGELSQNSLACLAQYRDGVSLYEYVGGHPLLAFDYLGLTDTTNHPLDCEECPPFEEKRTPGTSAGWGGFRSAAFYMRPWIRQPWSSVFWAMPEPELEFNNESPVSQALANEPSMQVDGSFFRLYVKPPLDAKLRSKAGSVGEDKCQPFDVPKTELRKFSYDLTG